MKPEETTAKVIRLNQEKKITHFGRCFLSVDFDSQQLIFRAPDFTPLFTSSLGPIFFQRRNFLFAVDTVTFNDYVLVFSKADVCTNFVNKIKKVKTMDAINAIDEEDYFKNNFYVPILRESKAGINGANEMKQDIFLLVAYNAQHFQEYMEMAFGIRSYAPQPVQHQSIEDHDINDYDAEWDDPTENSNSSDIDLIHDSGVSDTSLVDGMNSVTVRGSSNDRSSRKRNLRNDSYEEMEASSDEEEENDSYRNNQKRTKSIINNDNEIQRNDPAKNSNLSDVTVFHDSHLSDNVALVERKNSEAVPGSSNEQRKSQNVNNEESEASSDDDEEDNLSKSKHVVQNIIKSPGYKLYEKEYYGKMYPSLFIFDTSNESLGFDYGLHSSRKNFYCRACKLKFGIFVTAKLIKDENGEHVELGINKHQCEQKEFQHFQKPFKRLIVADEGRNVKLPYYKLYQKQWGGKICKRLVIFDQSNPSLGYEFGFRHAQNDYYCWECKTKFGTWVCAKLVEDENGDYIQFGIKDHKCQPKMLENHLVVLNS